MRRKPFRITEIWAKAVYIVVGWMLVPVAKRYLLWWAGIPEAVDIALDLVLSFAVIAVGTRVFRVRGEAIEPPRVWWRATGRPAAGFVLFALFAFSSLSLFLPTSEPVDPTLGWYVVTNVPVAVFYLHSSIRLVRGDAPVPPRPSRDDDARLLSQKPRI